jgi:hypothetical protein
MNKRSPKLRVPPADGTPSVCSLPLGRLFAGHVNALTFVLRHGTTSTSVELRTRVGGKIFGVWKPVGA